MIDHVEFEGRAEWGFNAVNDINTDENGHGSHVRTKSSYIFSSRDFQ